MKDLTNTKFHELFFNLINNKYSGKAQYTDSVFQQNNSVVLSEDLATLGNYLSNLDNLNYQYLMRQEEKEEARREKEEARRLRFEAPIDEIKRELI